MTTSVIFTCLGQNREKRIWLQGVSLIEPGFDIGTRFKRTIKAGTVIIEACVTGKLKVSRKKIGGIFVPTIDTENKDVEMAFPFEVGTPLRVVCRNGRITIRVHPDVAAKKEREARILERFKSRKSLSFGYFFEDSSLTTALNEGLIKFGHESFVQLGVCLSDQLKPTQIEIPHNCQISESSVLCGNFDQLMVAINSSPKPAPVDFLYAGDPSIHSTNTAAQASPFFFKIRTIEALNPAVVMFDIAEDPKAKNVPALVTVALQIMAQLGYVIQSEVFETENGLRRCILAVSEGLSKHNWIKLLVNPIDVKTVTQDVSSFTHSYIEARKHERQNDLCETLHKGEPLRSLSAFHGGGILANAIHLGLSSGKIESEISVGIELEDKYLSSSLLNNRAIWSDDPIVIQGSISSSRPSLNMQSIQIAELGIPCTGASRSGISKNKISCAEEHKDAGSMFYWGLRHLEAANIPMILCENVREYLKTVSMKVIKDTLSVLGYTFQERFLSGMEFGSFEDRHRLCFLAVSESLSEHFDLNHLVPTRKREASLGLLLEDIPKESHMWKEYSYLAVKQERDIAAGKGFRRQLLNASSPKSGSCGKGYGKARGTEPFVIAQHDSTLSRLFTIEEHALVKTIPPALVRGLNSTCAHEILGQSVIHCKFVAVGRMMASGLRRLQQEVRSCDDFKRYTEKEQIMAA